MLACMAQLKQEAIKHQTTLYLSGYTDTHLDQYFRELIVNHFQIETLLQDSLQRVNTGYSKSIRSTSKSRSSNSSRHSSLIATMKAKASAGKVRLKYLEREQQMTLALDKLSEEQAALKSECDFEEAHAFCDAYSVDTEPYGIRQSVAQFEQSAPNTETLFRPPPVTGKHVSFSPSYIENGGSMSTNVSHMPHNGMMSQQVEQCDPPVCPDVSNIPVPMSYGIPAQHDSSLIPPSLSNSHGTNFHISNTVSSYSHGNSVVPCSQDVQNCSIFQSHLVPSSNLGPISSTHIAPNYLSRNSHLGIPFSGPSADASTRTPGLIQSTHHSAPVYDSALNQNQSHIPSQNLNSDALCNPAVIAQSEIPPPAVVYQMSVRPPPEPSKFSGENILSYPSWRTAFNALVNRPGISLVDRISYLQTYLHGEALNCVQGSLMFPSEEAYHKALHRLDQRYGDSYAIISAFRSRLDKWSRIAPNDGRALRELSDFLVQCFAAQTAYPDVGMFVDNFELTKIACKLPNSLCDKWVRYSRDKRLKYQHPPGLSDFVTFVEKEADIACDIMNNYQLDKVDNRPPRVHSHTVNTSLSENSTALSINSKPSRVHSHIVDIPMNENVTASSSKLSCFLCKDSHLLDQCPEFLKKSVEDRVQYVFQNRLCYSCLQTNHSTKFCQKRSICSVCRHSHPTSLHDGRLRNNTQESPKTVEQSVIAKVGSEKVDIPDQQAVTHVVNSTCFASKISNDDKCTSILPVYISDELHPEEEKLVYCLLDSQSDFSFITSDVCKMLKLSETPVTLSLSTLGSTEQLVPSNKVSNLLVRGYNRKEYVKVESLYTRDQLPVNRNHIPTPTKVKHLPHFRFLQSELMPLSDCPVGLLIGYDTAEALRPRRVVQSPCNDRTYAVEVTFGWSVVGMIQPECERDMDIIQAVSHHTEAVTESLTKQSCIVPKTEAESRSMTPESCVVLKTAVNQEVLMPPLVIDSVESVNSKYDTPISQKCEEYSLLSDHEVVTYLVDQKPVDNESHLSDHCSCKDKQLMNVHVETVTESCPFSNLTNTLLGLPYQFDKKAKSLHMSDAPQMTCDLDVDPEHCNFCFLWYLVQHRKMIKSHSIYK